MNATKSRTRKQPERHLNIGRPTNGHYALCITTGTGDKAERRGYYVRQIPADFGGLAFHVEKFSTDQVEGEPREYDVLLDEQTGHHTCECLGQTRWGHRHPCRHITALLALLASGRIEVRRPVPVPTPKQAVAVPVAAQTAEEETVALTAEPPKPRYCRHCGCLASEHVAEFCPA
jgi:hypothetical protein